MVKHVLGKDESQVRFLLRAPCDFYDMSKNIRNLFLKIISILPKYKGLARFYLDGNSLVIIKPNGVQVKNPIKNNRCLYIAMRGKNTGNTIVFSEKQNAKCKITLSFRDAKNNTIKIGENNRILDMDFRVRGIGANASIGNNNNINSMILHLSGSGKTDFYIGNGNLFSRDIIFWAGDTHSVLDKNKKLLNAGSNVRIGDNNWIGQNVCFLKNSGIANGCVVGFGSIVSKQFCDENCVIAGNPAKCVKENILWSEQFPAEYDGKIYRQI